jgi:hypothetical protein
MFSVSRLNRGAARTDVTTREPKRGFGPFSGTHITVIIVAVVVVAGFPFAASAVTGNNVFISDATSGAHAKVSSTGQLSTTASVSGAVTATQAAPSNMVSIPGQTGTGGNVCAFYTPPTGKALVVTSIDVYPINPFPLPTTENVNFYGAPATNCPVNHLLFSSGAYSAGDPPHTVDLGAGVALANGHFLDVTTNTAGTTTSLSFVVYGYLVAATACASGCM